MRTLEDAIVLAATAHKGAKDKAGAPYILHPLRVMLRLSTVEDRITAVLHDVVEDCPGYSLERLREEGYSEAVVEAVDSVTRRPSEDYNTFILRAGANSIGARVKYADLDDNADLSRIASPVERDFARKRKYEDAKALLRSLKAPTA